MAAPLLRTKLFIPPQQPGLVHRPRLVQLINEGLTRKLTLISAPAGFGKTTLLSEWISACQRPVAWLSLEEADNDPIRFWAYFLAALQALRKDIVKDAELFLNSEGQQTKLEKYESFVTLLLNGLSDFSEALAFVLEDYHEISDPEIHKAVSFLIDHLPTKMNIIITSRSDPPLPLARLRARGQMIELRADDLRFSIQEAVQFLNQDMQLNLSEGQIAALEARTEGWIAGLQLAAISMQKREDTIAFIDSFTGSHRFILDYLVDEVLSHQQADEQSFLLETSILERFTGPLCNSVTGREDGQRLLEKFEQSNLFIIPLDSERRWYRYHHLFADLLRRRLLDLKKGQVRELHQRACDWYDREGLLPEAIYHAIKMNDHEKAAQLIERAAELQRQRGEVATLTAWINSLPDNVRRSHPALCLSYARALVDTSQNISIEEWINDAKTGLEIDPWPGDPKSKSLQGQIAALQAYLAMIRHQYEETIRLSRMAQELLGEDEARWRSFVGLTLAGAYRFTNEWSAASQTYLEASNLSRMAGDKVNTLEALSLRGEVLQAQGHLHQSDQQYQQVIRLAEEYGIPNAPVTGYALIGLGRDWCEWNDLEAAERYTRAGIENGKRADIQDILLRGCFALARIRQASGDSAGALEALDYAEPAVRQIGLAEVKDWVDAYRAQIWLAAGETKAAINWASSFSGSLYDTIYPSVAIGLAKVRLVQKQAHEALRLLDHALQSAMAVGRLGNAVQIMANKAIAQGMSGEEQNALVTLSGALNLAAPEGYIRVFLDEGEPMRDLIDVFRSWRGAPQQGSISAGQNALAEYTRRLLNDFARSPSLRVQKPVVAGQAAQMPEPLTERELEVLHLMAAGLSNRDIANKDIVSINTVKTQVKSIYGKLGIHSRASAISTARELGLL